MSFLRFREKQIVVGAVLLAALVAISSGIDHFGNSLAHKSVPEHPFAWAELASRFQGRRIGVMCSSAAAVDSVDRARLIAISWACSPHPTLAIDFSDVAGWPQVIISSEFLSASDRRRILDAGYEEVASNEFAIAWTNAGVTPTDPPVKVSPLRESIGVVVVLAAMLALWAWWRRFNGALPSKWTFCCAAIVFAVLSTLTLTHTLTSPNGLGVYAGKAKLFLVCGGMPRGFFTLPEYAIYQPSYPPGLTLAALLAYVVSWACGDWLVQLIVPFALSLLFLELADCTSRFVALAVALAMVSVPVAIKMAGGFYAEPLAALMLAMGLHRVWRQGDWAGWLMAGASGLFRHECIVLVIALWAAEKLLGAGAKWRHLAVAAAFTFAWESFAYFAGAKVYDFDFCSLPAVRRVLLALAAAFSWKAVAAVVVLCAAGGRRCGHVAVASLLFLLASALLASFNVTPHFEWFLANMMPRVAWLAVVPLAARAIFENMQTTTNERKQS